MSTHADRLAEAERALDEAGVLGDAQVFLATHCGQGRLTDLVRQAWDLDAIGNAYQAFVTRFSTRPTADPLVATIELVHAWRRFPWIDPRLPDDLLPAPWSGVTAAALFAEQHADRVVDARAAWQALPA